MPDGAASTVRLLGLDELDADELRAALPGEDVAFERATDADEGDVLPEPMTVVAVVVISAQVIKGLTAWLLKKRQQGTVELMRETELPNGTRERELVTINFKESSPDADVVREVGEKFGADSQMIADALAALAGH